MTSARVGIVFLRGTVEGILTGGLVASVPGIPSRVCALCC